MLLVLKFQINPMAYKTRILHSELIINQIIFIIKKQTIL